ncbi:MAG: hypothetical protein K0R58_367 [Ramlibacter sp.]|nr:hypothetical protein [Ramlibacter sp.]MCE3270989.1 hypothetical protein [Ramlibacter sp.]
MNATPRQLAQRRAALAVHAMSPVDQDWLLRELPLPHRSLLQPLLAELHAIGIPQDPALLRDATRAAPEIHAPRAGQVPDIRLSAGSARSLARWLRSQPAQVSVRLLAACPDWRVRLMGALPREDRRALESLAASLAPAPELERLVLAAARRQLAADAGSSRLAWLRRWTWPVTRREQI